MHFFFFNYRKKYYKKNAPYWTWVQNIENNKAIWQAKYENQHVFPSRIIMYCSLNPWAALWLNTKVKVTIDYLIFQYITKNKNDDCDNSTQNRDRKPLRRASLDRCFNGLLADIWERLYCCDLQFITAGEDKLKTQLQTDSSCQTLIGVTFQKHFQSQAIEGG